MRNSDSLTLEPVPIGRLPAADNLFQGRLWAELKAGFGWKPTAFRLRWRSRETGLLALVRGMEPEMHVCYVPAGPDIYAADSEHGALLESLSEALYRFLPESTVYVRYDLPWRTPYAGEDHGDSPETVSSVNRPAPRIRELRMNFGTDRRNLRKAWTDLQPADTLILDLAQGPERILSRMRAKTRYNIRLAARRGVRVRTARAGELPFFYELYAQTAKRAGITLHEYRYFDRILSVASKGSVPARTQLLIAEAHGVPLAGMVLAVAGRRATYLYGASSNRSRELMPTYALQWEAIGLARRLGCTEYDLYGIPPSDDPAHPMHGLYRFKTGFGGSFRHRRGCWDYPFAGDTYELVAGRELSGAGYHLR